MRYLCFSLLFLVILSLHGEESQGVAAFVQTITDATNKRDFSMIPVNSYEVDVPQSILDQSRAAWAQLFSGKYPEDGWRFDRCSFVPLESFKELRFKGEDTNVSESVREALKRSEQSGREIYAQMTKPFLQDGQLYEYNLKVIGMLILHFKKDKQDTGRGMPIGITPSGDIRFTLLKEAKS